MTLRPETVKAIDALIETALAEGYHACGSVEESRTWEERLALEAEIQEEAWDAAANAAADE